MLSTFLSKRRIQGLLLGLILIVSLVTGSMPIVQAHASAPALFNDAGAAAADIRWDAPSHVMRSRYVNVNAGLLLKKYSTVQDVQSDPEVGLNLFDDANYTGVITDVKKTSTGYSWVGDLKGKSNGYFYMLTYKDVFIAHVASADGVYEISSAGDNLYRIIQIDQSKFVDEPAALEQISGAKDLLKESDMGPTADSRSRIDVMVAYTAAARVAVGGTTKMKALIALAVLETNTSYSKAGITTRLRLVHTHEFAYTESPVLETNLNRFAGTSDGFMDSVHTLRNTYGADMVSLIVKNGGGYCGIAKGIMATAATAFQVVQKDCATGYYSFGHEFGHLQGARHDTYVDPTLSPFKFGHGYTHLGSTVSTRWRTVMAYDNKCAVTYPYISCTRLQYWSNPGKLYGGAKMGNTTYARNYAVLNATAFTVANFRQQVVP